MVRRIIKFWTAEEIEYIRQNYGKIDNEQIAATLDRSKKSILRKASCLGIQKQKEPAWTAEEVAFLKANYHSKDSVEIGSILGRTRDAIITKAGKLGLQKLVYHTADRDFFAVPNLINSYWAGFIAADGCIVQNPTASTRYLSIGVSEKDAAHIQLFADTVKFTGAMRLLAGKKKLDGTNCREVKLTISCCQNWFEDLERNFNITRQKSLTLQPPAGLTMPQNLAFIAGYFDGDGSVDVKHKKIELCFVGSQDFINWVRMISLTVAPHTIAVKPGKPYKHSKAPVYYYRIHGDRAILFAREILTLNLPLMPRKWDVIRDAASQPLRLRWTTYKEWEL